MPLARLRGSQELDHGRQHGEGLKSNSRAWHGTLRRELGYALHPSCHCHPARLSRKQEDQAIFSLGVSLVIVLSHPLGNTAILDEMKPEAVQQPEDSPVAPWETVRVAWDVWSRCCQLLTQAGYKAIMGPLGLSLFRPRLLFCPVQPTILHMGPLTMWYSPDRRGLPE